jgi:hypothetical protein
MPHRQELLLVWLFMEIRMNKLWVILALLAPLSLSGCVIAVNGNGDDSSWSSDWKSKETMNRKNLEKLELGMSIEQVRLVMGVADFDEKLSKEDKAYQLLFYRTQRSEKDGVTSKDECTPLVFENGELKGWGSTALTLI